MMRSLIILKNEATDEIIEEHTRTWDSRVLVFMQVWLFLALVLQQFMELMIVAVF